MPRERAREVDAIFAHHDHVLFAPDLLDVEVLSTLRRWLRAALISEAIAERAVRNLNWAPIDRLPCAPLTAAIWERRHNLTPYDAAYVALAADLRCPLVTFDARLARAPALGIEIVGIDQ